MARFIGSLNEGSLLRRTLLCVSTFVLGSLTVVALMSVILVSIAKSILPSHEAAEGADEKAQEASASEEPATDKPSAKAPRTKRPRSAPAAEPETRSDAD